MSDCKSGAICLLKKLLSAQLIDREPQTAADCLSEEVWLGMPDGRDAECREEALAYLKTEAASSHGKYSLVFMSETEKQIEGGCNAVSIKAIASCGEISVLCLASAVTKPENGELKIASLHISIVDNDHTSTLEKYYRQSEQLRLYRLSQNAGAFRILTEGSFPLLYGNDRLYQILGYESPELREKLRIGCMDYVHPDDRRMVMEKIQTALSRKDTYTQWTMRIFTGAGELRYMQVVGSFITTSEGRVMEGIEIDVTEQKLTEAELYERNAIFDILLENSKLSMWTYDRTTHLATQIKYKNHSRQTLSAISDFDPEAAIAAGLVKQSSVEELRELVKRADAGEPTASAEIWYAPKDREPWCDRVTFISIFDDDKNIIRTIAIADDITEQKRAQQQYEEELIYQRELRSDDLLTKVRGNLSKNILESYESSGHVGVCYDGMPYDASVEAVSKTGYSVEERSLIRQKMDAKPIMESFESGRPLSSFEYRRKTNDGRVIWVRVSIKTYRDMKTGDIKCFIYTIDINREKMNEAITKAIVNDDYDYIMLVDIRNNSFSMFRSNDELVLVPPQQGDDYIGMMRSINRAVVSETDVDRAINDMMPETIRKNLENFRTFSAVYTVTENNGSVSHKKITYTWLSRDTGQILITRTDVSEIVREQQRQQELLKNALLQAKQASSAKTDFLSKMSHEIRTPMNAIIGMNALAAQSLNDPGQAADCIAKVGISARFLLSLINDILDMSRIESGHLNLRNENIPFEEFINGVNGIIYEQATERGLSYDSIITGFIADNYIGDAMKLQQVLINLLGNAVKFTPKGGKIQLIVSQERTDNDKAWLKFTVNDTGIGISEEFQKVMFEPFEQEQNGVTTPYNGTGLGLAITKNLVQLMGGSITVNSIVGIGSEFVVTLPLGISEETNKRRMSKNIPLDKMSALVVDDEILICQQTRDLLLEIGMKAEWVDSGYKAVTLVRSQWEAKKCYDIILIDWKMPEMDGIETARQIRRIVGPDVTIIIITAYEWGEIEREAKAAGVNLLVSKPIFKSSLVSTFERIYTEKKRVSEEAAKPVEYDFTGKRVLLTEDHLLNVEVAKRLLAAKGFEVEVAENGLAAIETFTTHPDNYFDIILMDIRMPVMDGLTAVRSIRQLKKPSAKTIPIIAMSANAFDDDIEKSRAAGMNAHLSKPIEPNLLYETLSHFLMKDE